MIRALLPLMALLIAPGAASAATFSTPSWLADEDPGAPELYSGKVWSTATATGKTTLDVETKIGTATVYVDEMLVSHETGFRDAAQLAYTYGALDSAPVETNEVAEYADRWIVRLSTTVQVKDPALMAKLHPEFAQFVRTDVHSLSDKELGLSAEQLLTLEKFTLSPPVSALQDPDLYKAIQLKDPYAVYRAGVDGVGFFEVTDVFVVIKQALAIAPQVPKGFESGDLAEEGAAALSGMAAELDSPPVGLPVQELQTSGTDADAINVAFGYTLSDGIWVARTVSYAIGRARGGAGYLAGFGLRYPMRFAGQMSPERIDLLQGVADVQVDVSAIATGVNGSTDFYNGLGIEPFGGQEFYIGARAWIEGYATVFGKLLVDIKGPNSDDWSVGGDKVWDKSVGADWTTPLGPDDEVVGVAFPFEDTGLKYSAGVLSLGVDLKAEIAMSSDSLGVRARGTAISLRNGDGVYQISDEQWHTAATTLYADYPADWDLVDGPATTVYGMTLTPDSYVLDSSMTPLVRGRGKVDLRDWWLGQPSLSTPWYAGPTFDFPAYTFYPINGGDTVVLDGLRTEY